jgi:hypothetical protein
MQMQMQMQQMVPPSMLTTYLPATLRAGEEEEEEEELGPEDEEDDDARSVSTAGASSVATGTGTGGVASQTTTSHRTTGGAGSSERIQVRRSLQSVQGLWWHRRLTHICPLPPLFSLPGVRPRKAAGRASGGGVRVDVAGQRHHTGCLSALGGQVPLPSGQRPRTGMSWTGLPKWLGKRTKSPNEHL